MLECLTLYGNRVHYLSPLLFSQLTRLKELYLRNNGLESVDPNLFKCLKCLEILDLSKNNLKEFKHLISILKDLVNLKTINLAENLIFNIEFVKMCLPMNVNVIF